MCINLIATLLHNARQGKVAHLHGWLWGVTAVLGTVGGLALRPLFGLSNPKPSDSVC